jgi:hypothetical protein
VRRESGPHLKIILVSLQRAVFEHGDVGEQKLAHGPLHERLDPACIPSGDLSDDQAPIAQVLRAALFPVRPFQFRSEDFWEVATDAIAY